MQQDGPEAGLHERATAPEVCAYYDRVLRTRLLASGKVSFYPNCDYLGEGRFVSRVSGRHYEVRGRRRIVDARYLSPWIPATTPPPYGVADGVTASTGQRSGQPQAAPSEYVIVGSGKTATDACIWLLDNGVDPDAICWVRPRDPWMLNRAVVQPDPVVFLGTAADIMEAAAAASTADDVFFLLEDAGVMLRIDRSVTPTMAKVPTLAQWELDRLRTIDRVVRLGHLRHVRARPGGARRGRGRHRPGRRGRALCRLGAAVPAVGAGLGPRGDHVQPIRITFACFGAALAGYVEATLEDDAEKNRLCPPAPFSNTPADWARQQVLGSRASSITAYPDIRDWADGASLNPGRIPPELAGSAAVTAAQERLAQHVGPGMARLAQLAETAY